MFNSIFPKIHKEGYKFLAISILVTFVALIFSKFLGSILILITVWVYYFFRDPERYSINDDTFLVSPADGLVTDIFPYNWTRNPMYTGLTFWICPIIALLINNLLSLTLGFLIIFIYHNNIVIAREEKLLKSIFGKRYEEYCRKVNRWGIF